MIRVLQGQEHEDYIKLICSLMFINEEKNNIEFYISNNIANNFMIIKDNVLEIFLSTNSDVKGSIIYMLQKYRFNFIFKKDNKNQVIVELMDNYLANYYRDTLFLDFTNQQQIIDWEIEDCKKYINEVEQLEFNSDSIMKIVSCRNILERYKQKYESVLSEEFHIFSDAFKGLNLANINEKYSEIEQAYNKFVE